MKHNQMLRIFACLLLAISAYIPIHAQQAFSIEEAVQFGLKNHVSVKYDAIKIQDAEEQMRAIKASGLPQVSGVIDYNYFIEVPQLVIPPDFDPTGMGGSVSFQLRNSLGMGINMGMLAFDGSYTVALRAAKVYRDFIALQTEQTPINLRIAITQAYHSVLIAQRNKEQLSKNLIVLQDLRKETAAIQAIGLIEKLDVDRIDLSISTLEATMKNLDRGLEVVKSLLKFQMQYPDEQDIILTDSFEELYAQAVVANNQSVTQHNIKNRIEYNIIDKGIELADLDIIRNKKGYLPSVSLIASFQRAFQTDNIFRSGGFWLPASVVGFSVNVPIFDGFARDANIERAKLTLEKSKLDKTEFERAVGLEVKNARMSYLNAIESVKDREKAIALAEEIFRVAQIKYKEGIGSSFEVKQAESDFYGAQANYISAQYEVINSKFTLQKALGVYSN